MDLEEDWGEEVLNEIGNDKAVLHIEDISNDGAPQRLVDLALKLSENSMRWLIMRPWLFLPIFIQPI